MEMTDLPDKDDHAAIFRFAMSFNGYEEFGSFEASADAARSGDRSSLKMLRNELFSRRERAVIAIATVTSPYTASYYHYCGSKFLASHISHG